MLEKAWAGFEVHTEHGYNIGKACYGYRAEPVPHPVPAKRAKGIKKSLLEAHPVECHVVRRIFEWRIVERLSCQAIADRLNLDRHDLLDAGRLTLEADQQRERAERIDALRRAIAEDATKGKRLLRGLELVDEPDKDFIRDINQRRAELREHRSGLERQLAELENDAQDAPNPDLLSRLPVRAIDLAGMPDALTSTVRGHAPGDPLRPARTSYLDASLIWEPWNSMPSWRRRIDRANAPSGSRQGRFPATAAHPYGSDGTRPVRSW